jgi:hypothetical protein
MWESIGRPNTLEFLRQQRIPTPTARGQAALPPPQWAHVRPPFRIGQEKLSLSLQDHNHPVRYRDIGIRELK